MNELVRDVTDETRRRADSIIKQANQAVTEIRRESPQMLVVKKGDGHFAVRLARPERPPVQAE